MVAASTSNQTAEGICLKKNFPKTLHIRCIDEKSYWQKQSFQHKFNIISLQQTVNYYLPCIFTFKI